MENYCLGLNSFDVELKPFHPNILIANFIHTEVHVKSGSAWLEIVF